MLEQMVKIKDNSKLRVENGSFMIVTEAGVPVNEIPKAKIEYPSQKAISINGRVYTYDNCIVEGQDSMTACFRKNFRAGKKCEFRKSKKAGYVDVYIAVA
jgi:hypothetical protein